MRQLDKSKFLINTLAAISEFWARYRGLPIIAGIALVIVSFVVQLVNVSANSIALDYIYVITHNIGILLALIGILMLDPLGK